MNTANIAENMDIDEKAACNVKNREISYNPDQKRKNSDHKNLTSNVDYIDIAQNLASFFKNLTIEENCVNEVENTDIEDRPTSSVEIMDKENPASNVENTDIEENSVDSEKKNAQDMESICRVEGADIIAVFRKTLSDFIEAIEYSLHEITNARKLLASNFIQGFLLSEKGQRLVALMKKQDSCISAIKQELKYWDDVNYLTNDELKTLIANRKIDKENPFAGIVKEGAKLLKYEQIFDETLGD